MRNRGFRLFWVSALISNSASWLQIVVVPLILYDLTESNTWLGTSALASAMPAVVLTPMAGVLADRVSRRIVLIVTQSIQAIIALMFLVLWESGGLTPLSILLLQFVSGLSVGIQVPTWQSFVPTLVPRELLLDAIRLNSVQFTASRALGPMLAGLILVTVGNGGAFLINAVTFVVVVGALLVVRPLDPRSPASSEPLRRQFREGWSYVRAHTSLWQACVTGFVVSFCGQSLVMLTAGLAEEVYHDEHRQSWLVASVGFGSMVTASFVLTQGDRVRRSSMCLVALLVYAGSLVLLAATDVYPVGLAAFFVMGMAHLAVTTAVNTSTQAQVPDRLRGRVLSIYLLGVLLGVPMGAQVWGFVGDLAGLRVSIALCAALMSGFLAVCLTTFGRLRSLDLAQI